MNTQEKKITQVICSVPYHCPHKLVNLTFNGLEEEHFPPQKGTVGSGVIQTALSFEPTWEDNGKMLSCLFKSGAEVLSQSTVKLDVTCKCTVEKEIALLHDGVIRTGFGTRSLGIHSANEQKASKHSMVSSETNVVICV